MTTAWTPERREKQREVALKLVEEGKFGGKGRGQGRPRTIRASERVAERVASEGDAIFERLMEITRDGKNSDSISAAKTLLDTEERERKMQIVEDQAIEDMHRNDLLALVWNQLKELGEDGTIRLPFIEGELIEIEERGSSDISEESEEA